VVAGKHRHDHPVGGDDRLTPEDRVPGRRVDQRNLKVVAQATEEHREVPVVRAEQSRRLPPQFLIGRWK
jgi:hypothetical protein